MAAPSVPSAFTAVRGGVVPVQAPLEIYARSSN